MIGLDTPETVHPSKPVEEFGKEASNFAKKVLTDREVILSYDWDPRDKYNRILDYIWIPFEYLEQTRYVLFNLLAIVNGFGHAYTSFTFNENYMQTFLAAESYARDSSLGLWTLEEVSLESPVEDTNPGYDPTVYITSSGTKYHREGCIYLKDNKIAVRLSEAKRRGYTPCGVCNPPK
jgi:micrococcal nuclease